MVERRRGECYRRGAARFDWQSRNPEPRSERDGNWLIGKGMATAGYPVFFPMQPQRARARLYADGSAVVQAGTQDFGTGSGTAMTQVAADGLGVAVENIRFEYGDTDLPNVAAAVGSAGAGMLSAAVHTAVTTLRDQMIEQALADPDSPLHQADPAAVVVRGGRMDVHARRRVRHRRPLRSPGSLRPGGPGPGRQLRRQVGYGPTRRRTRT